MTLLQNQEQFESIWQPKSQTANLRAPLILYFTAQWCKPCKRLDWVQIRTTFPKHDFMICDCDENEYTPGYLGVRGFPTFLILTPAKKLIGPFTNSDTTSVIQWLQDNFPSE